MHVKARFLMFWCAVAAVACGGANGAGIRGGQRPSWVDGRVTGDGEVIVGVGLSQLKSDQTAQEFVADLDAAARAELAKKLRVSVSSEVSSTQAASTRGGDTFSLESHTREVVAALDLQGIEITDRWRDDAAGVAYALAVLDKARTSARLQAQTGDHARAAQAFAARGDQTRAADPASALRQYLRARAEMEKATQSATLFRVITGKLADVETPATLDGELATLVHGVQLRVSTGDRQRAPEHAALPHPIEVAVTLQRGGQSVPLAGLPLAVAFEGGVADARATTDPAGLARIAVRDVGVFAGAERTLRIRLDMISLAQLDGDAASRPPQWLTALQSAELPVAIVKKSKESLRVLVKIVESIDGGARIADSLVQTAVMDALLAEHVGVQDGKDLIALVGGEERLASIGNEELTEKARKLADVVVIGTARSAFSSNYAEPAVWHRARALIRVVDMANGQILATVDLEAKGEKPGIGPDKAGKQALRALAAAVARPVAEAVRKGLGL